MTAYKVELLTNKVLIEHLNSLNDLQHWGISVDHILPNGIQQITERYTHTV